VERPVAPRKTMFWVVEVVEVEGDMIGGDEGVCWASGFDRLGGLMSDA